MSCTMYQRGNCLKQPIGAVTVGFITRESLARFQGCQFDGRVWAGGRAVLGRLEDATKNQRDCSMYEGSTANVVSVAPAETILSAGEMGKQACRDGKVASDNPYHSVMGGQSWGDWWAGFNSIAIGLCK
jgi:hypothetical protein